MSKTRAAAVLTFAQIAIASRRCVEVRAALYLHARTPLLLFVILLAPRAVQRTLMEGAQLGGQGADARAMGSRIAQGDTAAESASAIASALHVGGTSGKRGGKRCSGRLAEPGRERG